MAMAETKIIKKEDRGKKNWMKECELKVVRRQERREERRWRRKKLKRWQWQRLQ